MTQDDRLVESMFDEVTEVRVKPGGKAKSKLVSPSAEEMEEAQAAFLVAEKKFRALDGDPACVTDRLVNVWLWYALDALYVADKRLWRLFVGPDPSVRSNQQYNAYRERLARGKRLYRADA